MTLEAFLTDGTYLCATGEESTSTPNFTVNDGYLTDGAQCEGDFAVPRGVVGIGRFAFSGATLITSITIPATVTSIGEGSFSDASSLRSFYFLGNAPTADADAFTNVAKEAIAFIKPGATDFAPVGEIWNGLIVDEFIPNGPYPCLPGVESSSSYTITDYVVTSGKDCSGDFVIPSGVTGISDDAFRQAVSLKTITIPATVTHIDDNAFYGATGLNSIFFLGNAPTVGFEAFHNVAFGATAYVNSDATGFNKVAGKWNELLVDVLAPDGTYLCATGEESESTPAFTVTNGVVSGGAECEGAVVIPEGVRSIGNFAFDSAASLTSLTLPSTLRSIGDYAFINADALTGIAIPARVSSIGEGVFAGATSLTTITVNSNNANFKSTGNVLFNKLATTLIAYPAQKIGNSYSIPAGVVRIENFAFYDANSLTSITISASVTSIGNNAFANTSLTSITIPAGVTNIGVTALPATTLTTITVASGNANYSSVAGVLFNKLATTLIAYPAQRSGVSYSIPAGVTSIGNSAFAYSALISSITIPTSVTSIGDRAFAFSTLKGITIPAGVTIIGEAAFFYAESLATVSFANGSSLETIGQNAFDSAIALTDIVLPAGITTVGNAAFIGATSLTRITIPSGVTSIGDNAFADSTALQSILFLGNAPTVGDAAFENVSPEVKAYVRSGAENFEVVEGVWSGLVIEEFNYIITYNTGGGTAVNPDSFNDAGSIESAPISTRIGYTLMGWSTSATGSVVTFPYSPAATDITLYAKWRKNPVKAVATTKPTLKGKAVATAKGTNKLTANKGVWTGDPTPTFTFQWYSCTAQVKKEVNSIPKTCKIIAKATKSTLGVTNALKGKFLAVAVTGKVAGTTPTVWLSKSTTKVK